jgi:hypothetical protein
MLSHDLDPCDSTDIAKICFAASSPKVTSDKVQQGLFPECDYSIPGGRWPKSIWFRGTLDAWRRKHFALSVVTRATIRELQQEGTKEAEAQVRAILIDNMKKATAYATKIGADLMAQNSSEEQRDADHADAYA